MTQIAALIVICMGVMLVYVWTNYEELRTEQTHRQIWYMNNKF
jgi:hypothetical protein